MSGGNYLYVITSRHYEVDGADKIYKFGCTRNIRRRKYDSCYRTAFKYECRYAMYWKLNEFDCFMAEALVKNKLRKYHSDETVGEEVYDISLAELETVVDRVLNECGISFKKTKEDNIKKRYCDPVEEIRETRERNVVGYALSSAGFSEEKISKIKAEEIDLCNRIKSNPYNAYYHRLDRSDTAGADKVDFIAFDAAMLKLDPDLTESYERAEFYAMKKFYDHKSIYCGVDEIHNSLLSNRTHNGKALRPVSVDTFKAGVSSEQSLIGCNGDQYHVKEWRDCEEKCAQFLDTNTRHALNDEESGALKQVLDKYSNDIAPFRDAVGAIDNLKTILEHKLSIVTGPPGCGKSTLIANYAVRFYDQLGYEILLCAPTGCAATELMNKARHVRAHNLRYFTVHRLIMEDHMPNEKIVVIIDEASMLNVPLFGRLVRVLPPAVRMIFLGDIKQLPCVGVGRLFYDMLHHPKFKEAIIDMKPKQPGRMCRAYANKLDKNYVLAAFMELFDAAYYGIEDTLNREIVCEGDKVYEPIDVQSFDMGHIRPVLDKLWEGCPNFGRDTVIIAPTNKLVRELNNYVRGKLNRADKYCVGEMVMFTRNRYEDGRLVYCNGDIGRVTAVSDSEITIKLTDNDDNNNGIDVSIDDKHITYAYAMTIHKSQGKGFDTTIVVAANSQNATSNMLYTAMTRTKRRLVLIKSRDSYAQFLMPHDYISVYSRICEIDEREIRRAKLVGHICQAILQRRDPDRNIVRRAIWARRRIECGGDMTPEQRADVDKLLRNSIVPSRYNGADWAYLLDMFTESRPSQN